MLFDFEENNMTKKKITSDLFVFFFLQRELNLFTQSSKKLAFYDTFGDAAR